MRVAERMRPDCPNSASRLTRRAPPSIAFLPMAASPDVTERVLAWARVDFSPAHRPPQWWRVAVATVLAIGLSLAADAALVAIGTRLFPATKGYVHFAFSDYAKLTVHRRRHRLCGVADRGPLQLGAAVALLPPGHRRDARPVPARRLHLAPGPTGARRGGAHGDAPGDRADHLQPVGPPGPGAPGSTVARRGRGTPGEASARRALSLGARWRRPRPARRRRVATRRPPRWPRSARAGAPRR